MVFLLQRHRIGHNHDMHRRGATGPTAVLDVCGNATACHTFEQVPEGLTIFGIQPHIGGENTYLEWPALEEDVLGPEN